MDRTILIVDDNPDGIMLMQFALERIDPTIPIETASSGEEALELLRSRPRLPALMLLDLKMPGMGGIGTLEKIRADETLKELPVVIATLSILQSDADAAQKAGANGFIRRSITIDDLARDIEEHVRRWAGKA